MLDKLREMTGGDEERLKMYVSLYLESMPEYCDLMEKAITEGDLEQIKYSAHASKPLFSTLGFDRLYNEADSIEIDIRGKGEHKSIIQKAEALLTSMKETISLLKS